MKLKKFLIFDPKQSEPMISYDTEMLINLDHIVSVKPIKMMTRDGVVDGYWIRTTNGKKYRALQIPCELVIELAKEMEALPRKTEANEETLNFQQ